MMRFLLEVSVRTLPIAILIVVAGCGPGRDYKSPQVVTPAAWQQPATAGGTALARWWTSFNDPRLDRLVDQTLSRNLDLA